MLCYSWRKEDEEIARPLGGYQHSMYISHCLCSLVTYLVSHNAIEYILPKRIKLEAATVITGYSF